MARLGLKRNFGKIWPAQTRGRKIILLYHSVGNTSWGMAERDFCDQINWLSDHSRVLSLTDLIHAKSSEELQVAITFDDGYQSLYDYVGSILAEKNIHPMVYINTGWMGNDEKTRKKSVADLGHYPNEAFLTWPEVKELHAAGWEIGSHGVNHFNFTTLQEEVLQQELKHSKQDIESHLSVDCLHFAYPWGRHSINVKKSLLSIGYQYAAAARHGDMISRSDLLELPRMNISRDYSFDDFKHIVKGKWNYLGWLQKIKGL